MSEQKPQHYTYKRYMRDGSVKEITAVVRSRSKPKKQKEKK
jgi:hypothetical protein